MLARRAFTSRLTIPDFSVRQFSAFLGLSVSVLWPRDRAALPQVAGPPPYIPRGPVAQAGSRRADVAKVSLDALGAMMHWLQ
jgi:hypothetical protein